ncbi:MAG: radical SAM protein [Candidatus Methanoperedens sp.]
MSYRESIFNVFIRNDNKYLLFNTLTGQILQLSDNKIIINELSNFQIKLMSESGFIVSGDFDHKKEFMDVINKIQRTPDCLYVVFTITTKCDLTCKYCFENRENRITMSPNTFKKSMEWIESKLSTGLFSKLYIVIFGGEPLLEPLYIKNLIRSIKKLCKKNNIDLLPILLTTNALKGTKKLFLDLKKIGLNHLQISFDGSGYFTNKNRKIRDGKNDHNRNIYVETLKLIPFLSHNFLLTIKLNFSPENILSIEEFFSDLIALPDLNMESVIIKPETIMITTDILKNKSTQISLYSPEDIELANAFDLICRAANEKQFKIDTSSFFITPCMAFSGSSFLIEPNGQIRNCISAFGVDEFYITDLSCEIKNDNCNSFSIGDINFNECINRRCRFFPLCAGGCPYEKLLLKKKMDYILCRKEYFEKALPVYVKQKWIDSKYHVYFQ